jgi:hypothetical protein
VLEQDNWGNNTLTSIFSFVKGVNKLQTCALIGHACLCGQRKPKGRESQMLVGGSRWCVWRWEWGCQRDLGRTSTASADYPEPGNNAFVQGLPISLQFLSLSLFGELSLRM